VEIGLVSFSESSATNNVCIVILENAAGGVEEVMDTSTCADIGNGQSSDNISTHSLCLVVFAPINVWSTGYASSIKNMSWAVLFNLCNNAFTVMSAGVGKKKKSFLVASTT